MSEAPTTPWGLFKWCLQQRHERPLRGPISGTMRMPKVVLPEGYEPPSAAVPSPNPDLMLRQLVTSWHQMAEELAAALYGAVGVHPDLMNAAPIANAVAMWQRTVLGPWPGFCQTCGAPLDPPNATTCRACFASDEDE